MKVLPDHAVDDNSEAPFEVRQHWCIIGNYRLMFGGTQITTYISNMCQIRPNTQLRNMFISQFNCCVISMCQTKCALAQHVHFTAELIVTVPDFGAQIHANLADY